MEYNNIKYYFTLLLLMVILSLEIAAASQNIKNSSEFHIREKRLINVSSNDHKATIQQIPYIVSILLSGRFQCGGSIFSSTVIITAAHCVSLNGRYIVLSGSSYVNRGTAHDVTSRIVHDKFKKSRLPSLYDIALIKISPAIDLVHSNNRNIQLYRGSVPKNTLGTLSGWGCNQKPKSATTFPEELQSINVPVIGQFQCQLHFLRHGIITKKHVCTFAKGQKGSCSGDSGGPLVVNGHLLGVMSYSIGLLTHPDVFIKVSDPDTQAWINSKFAILNGYL